MTQRYKVFFSIFTFALIVSTCYAESGASTTGRSPGSGFDGAVEVQKRMVAAVAAGDVAHGKTLYMQNCASCHGATGTEGGAGPSLKGEKSKKDQAAAVAWIKKPNPPMPKLYPSPLSEKDVSDVAAYVETL